MDGWLSSPTDTIRCPASRAGLLVTRSLAPTTLYLGHGQTADRRTDDASWRLPTFSTARQSRLSVVVHGFLNIAQHAVFVVPVHAARSQRATPRGGGGGGEFLSGRCHDHRPHYSSTNSTPTPLPSDHPPTDCLTGHRNSKRYHTRTHPRRVCFSTTAAAAAVIARADHDQLWSALASCQVTTVLRRSYQTRTRQPISIATNLQHNL